MHPRHGAGHDAGRDIGGNLAASDGGPGAQFRVGDGRPVGGLGIGQTAAVYRVGVRHGDARLNVADLHVYRGLAPLRLFNRLEVGDGKLPVLSALVHGDVAVVELRGDFILHEGSAQVFVVGRGARGFLGGGEDVGVVVGGGHHGPGAGE